MVSAFDASGSSSTVKSALSKSKTAPVNKSSGSNWEKLKATLPGKDEKQLAFLRKRKRAEMESSDAAQTSSLAKSQSAAAFAKLLQPGQATVAQISDSDKYVAMDCEFVGVGEKGSRSSLARVSIVNYHGQVVLDTFVRQKERVTDYRTFVSGVRPANLRGAPTFEEVSAQVASICRGRVLVGHAVWNDLQVLLLSHPRADTRDTALFKPLQALAKSKHPSLRNLSKLVLNLDIQKGEHSSVEDARATMAIYRAYKEEWDTLLKGGGATTRPKAQLPRKGAIDPTRRYRVSQTLGLAKAAQDAGFINPEEDQDAPVQSEDVALPELMINTVETISASARSVKASQSKSNAKSTNAEDNAESASATNTIPVSNKRRKASQAEAASSPPAASPKPTPIKSTREEPGPVEKKKPAKRVSFAEKPKPKNNVLSQESSKPSFSNKSLSNKEKNQDSWWL